MTKLQFQMIMEALLYILYAQAFPTDNNNHVRHYWIMQDKYMKEAK